MSSQNSAVTEFNAIALLGTHGSIRQRGVAVNRWALILALSSTSAATYSPNCTGVFNTLTLLPQSRIHPTKMYSRNSMCTKVRILQVRLGIVTGPLSLRMCRMTYPQDFVDLLTPSNQQWELDAIKKRHWNSYCPYLRFKQKPMAT